MIEVELKFPVAESDEVARRMLEAGGRIESVLMQADRYFNHPADDLAARDAALRLRSSGDEFLLTFKGPNLDTKAKVRREVELSLGRGAAGEEAADRMIEIWRGCGFEPVAEVHKRRSHFRLPAEGSPVDAFLDEVRGLGAFLELERLVVDAAGVPQARAELLSVARDLGLDPGTSIRTSYLDLLQDREPPPGRSSV